MDTAENPGQNQEVQDPAPAQAPQIPKWRLDEVSAQLRAAREEIEAKNQLLNQFRPQAQPQRGPTPEELGAQLGVDPQIAQAISRMADQVVSERLKAAEAPIQNAFASMNNKLEVNQFLLNHGKDKSKYLEKIRERQISHSRVTGQYMDVDTAYKLVAFDEMSARDASRPAQKAAPAVQTGAQAPAAQAAEDEAPGGVPDATQTRAAAGSAGSAKSYDEMTLDEKEAYLDRSRGDQFI